MLNIITLRNLIRPARMALFYKSRYVNGFVVLVYKSVISGFHIVKYISTALFSRDLGAKT